MTLSLDIAQSLVQSISRRVNLTIEERERTAREIAAAYEPVIVHQENLHFFTPEDEKANRDQREKILRLLQERRSAGATNAELATIALKYTCRVSELRQQPFNFRIDCTRESGRTFRYRLFPADWRVNAGITDAEMWGEA